MQTYPLGTRIGSYEIASNPMMGGMGVVYFCLDHANDGRPVALKTFKPEYLPDRAARDRFLREGTAWVQLGRHPHIVRCYAVEYIDPTAFLSLELIAKEQGMDDASLRPWLGAPMPVEQALLFALQIARGMKHATEKIPGFVHRDLKPENVLVGADKLPGTNVNRLRVTDFGLAAILKDEVGRLKDEEPESIGRTHLTHGIVGTPLYMAPEQWKGEALGMYTDIYALGCILYEMLTGQRAAGGNSVSELQAAHCDGKLRPVPENLSGDVQAFLRRSLSLAGCERYQSWDEMVDALQSLGAGLPALAHEEESLSEHRDAASSYNAMGVSYNDIGKAQVAISYFERALKLLHVIGTRQGESAALSNFGLAYARLGNARRAIEYYEKALNISREIGDRRGEGADLGNIGNAYSDMGNMRYAIEYFEQHLEIACEIGDRRGEGAALGSLGVAYKNLGDIRRAIGYYEKQLAITRKIGNRRGEGAALGNIGNVYTLQGNMQHAIGYCEQHLKIAREIGDRRGEGIALGNLGSAYHSLGDVGRAISYYEEALQVDHEIGDRHGEGSDLGNLGSAHTRLGEVQLAIQYFEQYLRIAREIGDRRGEENALSGLGVVYKDMGNVPHAIGYYEEALKIAHEIGDISGAALVSFNMAILHGEQSDIKRAIPLAQEAERIFAQIGSPNVQQAQQLQRKLQSSLAFEVFQCTDNAQEMQAAIGRYPLMKDDDFIRLTRQVIDQQVPPEDKPAFEQRLAWLQQIMEK